MYTDGFIIRSLDDISDVERIPLADRIDHDTVYGALAATARRHALKPALHFLPNGSADDEPYSFSYRDVIEKITQAANLFHDLGVGPNDVVSLMLPILPETEFALWGAETAGIANPINPFLEAGHLAGLMRAAGTKIVVTTGPGFADGAWQKIQQARDQIPSLETVLAVGGAPDLPSFESQLEQYPGDRLVSGRVIGPDDTAAYFHTGGTTGRPKLAKHSHRGQISQAWNTAAMIGIDSNAVTMIGLPFFHIGNSICASLRGLLVGETLVLLSPAGLRNPTVIRDHWRIIERYGVTSIGGVPTSLAAVLDVPVDGADIGSLKTGFTGGSAAPVELLEQFKKTIGIDVIEGWGMTETTSFGTLNPKTDKVRFGSAGVRVPYHQIKIIELDGHGCFAREAEAGEIGLLVISGPGVISGYVEDRHNRRAFIDGMPGGGHWLDTGDLGRIDKDGYLWLTGRAKDVIIRGGHNIDPLIIEEALSKHPAVQIAAAVGMADRHAGELPVAYVQLNAGAKAGPDELAAFARRNIPERAAAPVFVEICEALPLTAIGKVFKPALRRQAALTAFEAALAPLREKRITLAVAVEGDDFHGTLATISVDPVAAARRAGIEREIKDLLGRFIMPHTISWI